jgi:hypothetical protein
MTITNWAVNTATVKTIMEMMRRYKCEGMNEEQFKDVVILLLSNFHFHNGYGNRSNQSAEYLEEIENWLEMFRRLKA